MFEENTRVAETSKRELLINASVLIIALLGLYLGFRFLGSENIDTYVAQAGVFGPLLVILLKASTIVFAPLSGSVLYVAAGALYGFAEGFLYVSIGDFLGFTISFYISRFFGKKILNRFLGEKELRIVDAVLEEIGTVSGFFKTRFFFISFPEITSYAAGLTTLRFLPFISIQLGVHLILSIVIVFVGDRVVEDPRLLVLAVVGATGCAAAGVYFFSQKVRQRL